MKVICDKNIYLKVWVFLSDSTYRLGLSSQDNEEFKVVVSCNKFGDIYSINSQAIDEDFLIWNVRLKSNRLVKKLVRFKS